MEEKIINKPKLTKEAPITQKDNTNAEAEALMAKQEEAVIKAKPAVKRVVEPVANRQLPDTIPCDCAEGVNRRLNMVDQTYRCPKCHSWVSTEEAMTSDEIRAKKRAELEKQLKALED